MADRRPPTTPDTSREPVPEPARFRRLLEIVPANPEQREASREKYRAYREQGLSPETYKM